MANLSAGVIAWVTKKDTRATTVVMAIVIGAILGIAAGTLLALSVKSSFI
jgi:preprotein translocase subunit SecE